MATNGLEMRRSASGTGDLAGRRPARWALRLALLISIGLALLVAALTPVLQPDA